MKLFLVQKYAWVLIFYGFVQINLFGGKKRMKENVRYQSKKGSHLKKKKKEPGLIKFEGEQRGVSFYNLEYYAHPNCC